MKIQRGSIIARPRSIGSTATKRSKSSSTRLTVSVWLRPRRNPKKRNANRTTKMSNKKRKNRTNMQQRRQKFVMMMKMKMTKKVNIQLILTTC